MSIYSILVKTRCVCVCVRVCARLLVKVATNISLPHHSLFMFFSWAKLPPRERRWMKMVDSPSTFIMMQRRPEHCTVHMSGMSGKWMQTCKDNIFTKQTTSTSFLTRVFEGNPLRWTVLLFPTVFLAQYVPIGRSNWSEQLCFLFQQIVERRARWWICTTCWSPVRSPAIWECFSLSSASCELYLIWTQPSHGPSDFVRISVSRSWQAKTPESCVWLIRNLEGITLGIVVLKMTLWLLPDVQSLSFPEARLSWSYASDGRSSWPPAAYGQGFGMV